MGTHTNNRSPNPGGKTNGKDKGDVSEVLDSDGCSLSKAVKILLFG